MESRASPFCVGHPLVAINNMSAESSSTWNPDLRTDAYLSDKEIELEANKIVRNGSSDMLGKGLFGDLSGTFVSGLGNLMTGVRRVPPVQKLRMWKRSNRRRMNSSSIAGQALRNAVSFGSNIVDGTLNKDVNIDDEADDHYKRIGFP